MKLSGQGFGFEFQNNFPFHCIFVMRCYVHLLTGSDFGVRWRWHIIV